MSVSLVELKELFGEIDWTNFYSSASTDLISLCTTNRIAIRIPYFKGADNYCNILKEWAVTNNLYYSVDDFYFVISKQDNAALILKEDTSTKIHTRNLGQMLGYPICCSEWMETVGEQNIDTVESQLKTERIYKGNWKLIDSTGYLEGKSLLSHIPCSATCKPSLIAAKITLKKLQEYHTKNTFTNWNLPNKSWLIKLIEDNRIHV